VSPPAHASRDPSSKDSANVVSSKNEAHTGGRSVERRRLARSERGENARRWGGMCRARRPRPGGRGPRWETPECHEWHWVWAVQGSMNLGRGYLAAAAIVSAVVACGGGGSSSSGGSCPDGMVAYPSLILAPLEPAPACTACLENACPDFVSAIQTCNETACSAYANCFCACSPSDSTCQDACPSRITDACEQCRTGPDAGGCAATSMATRCASACGPQPLDAGADQ